MLDESEISIPSVFGLCTGATMLTWDTSNPLHVFMLIWFLGLFLWWIDLSVTSLQLWKW